MPLKFTKTNLKKIQTRGPASSAPVQDQPHFNDSHHHEMA